MSNTSGTFLGLAPDSRDEDRPPTDTQRANAELLADLKAVFKRQWAQHGRSQQKALGPSEIGVACPRRLAGQLMDLPRINPEGDPLPAWLGTAGHAKFEDAVEFDNDRIVQQWLQDRRQRCTVLSGVTEDDQYVGRWFSERRVTVSGDLAGTCDLYDTWTDTVIDLKFPGATKFQAYRKATERRTLGDESPEYRTQAHCYGRGYRNLGFDVKRVAIWFIPRGGQLSSSFVWDEPYSDEVVDGALARLRNITIAAVELQLDEHPERLQLVPKVAGSCMFCPFYTPRTGHEQPHACNGNND